MMNRIIFLKGIGIFFIQSALAVVTNSSYFLSDGYLSPFSLSLF
jgi:hypothetical protein